MLRAARSRGYKRACVEILRDPAAEGAAGIPAHRLLSTALGAVRSDESGQDRFAKESSQLPLAFALGRSPLLNRGFSVGAVLCSEDRQTVREYSDTDIPGEESSIDSESAGSLLSADAISDAASAAESLSLAVAWDDAWIINKGFQYALQYIHDTTGLPWWQSIVVATTASRIVTLPFNIKQLKNTARMARAQPELKRLAEWFKDQQAAGRGKEVQQEYMQRMAALWAKHDCNPLKSMLPLFAQAPIFIGFFQAIRSLAHAKARAFPYEVPSLAVGGPAIAWYGDLTVVDPYYTLPILSSLMLLLTVELNAADGLQGQDPTTAKRTKNLMRGVSALMLFVTSGMPQGVFYYWITSSMLALVQSTVFKIGAVRTALGLPSPSSMRPGSEAEVGGLTAAAAAAAAGKPVKTFSTPPRKQKTPGPRGPT